MCSTKRWVLQFKLEPEDDGENIIGEMICEVEFREGENLDLWRIYKVIDNHSVITMTLPLGLNKGTPSKRYMDYLLYREYFWGFRSRQIYGMKIRDDQDLMRVEENSFLARIRGMVKVGDCIAVDGQLRRRKWFRLWDWLTSR